MSVRRRIAILPVLSLLICLNAGCLNLSLFNRELPDTKARLDLLEQRVSALEATSVSHAGQPIIVPGPACPVPSTPARH